MRETIARDGEKTSKGRTVWWGDSLKTVETPGTPWLAARCNRRAGSERSKPSGRWKTVEAERGWAVVPLIPKRRQRWRRGSGLSGSEQRRGDLWKSQERHPVLPAREGRRQSWIRRKRRRQAQEGRNTHSKGRVFTRQAVRGEALGKTGTTSGRAAAKPERCKRRSASFRRV